MRTLHIAPTDFVKGSVGGGERYLRELTGALRSTGIVADILLCPNLRTMSFRQATVERAVQISIKAAVDIASGYDILHVHHLNRHTYDLGVYLKLRTGKKLVLSDHGGGQPTPSRLFGSLRVAPVDGLASVTRFSVTDVCGRRQSRVPIEILYGGGDHILRDPDPVLDRALQSDAVSQVDFLMVGRVLPHKGAHIAIDALPQNKSLRIVGEQHDDAYKRHLTNLAQGKSVEFVHDASDSSLPHHYASAGALVVPSVWSYGRSHYTRPELLGLVAIESLFCGTNVIGSDVGGLGELLAVLGQTLFPPGDIGALHQTMSSQGEQLTAPMGLTSFTWDAVGQRCQRLYSRII